MKPIIWILFKRYTGKINLKRWCIQIKFKNFHSEYSVGKVFDGVILKRVGHI